MSSGSDEDNQKPPAVSNKELNKLKNSKKKHRSCAQDKKKSRKQKKLINHEK